MPPRIALRLMSLGGSVTYGVGSPNGNGYRKLLQDLLLATGYEVRMVGSRKVGFMCNNENEGWREHRLEQIKNKAKRSIATVKPKLFTINAGSNDCIQNFQLDLFAERMENMLKYLWQTSPLSTISFSTLLVNADEQVNSRVLRVNIGLRDLVLTQEAQRRRIVLANMSSAEGPQLDDLMDGTHPSDDGYKRMADIWFRAIQKACARRFFERWNDRLKIVEYIEH
ncbi:uncharacterized protein FIESC28_10919 [Fusarium coffeatum]|uniref:Uncharacterized protein n=1 Tax=Fusarium coffeatum TaxID=231269 RepID=A0A366QPK4_9HYPO|nr:uncharacterized protein FIESC28_10919 [Fusarium coffeatum]RBR06803.1 hypothetical protein FIESC28_10919 [Fusarium coffeatum]